MGAASNSEASVLIKKKILGKESVWLSLGQVPIPGPVSSGWDVGACGQTWPLGVDLGVPRRCPSNSTDRVPMHWCAQTQAGSVSQMHILSGSPSDLPSGWRCQRSQSLPSVMGLPGPASPGACQHPSL